MCDKWALAWQSAPRSREDSQPCAVAVGSWAVECVLLHTRQTCDCMIGASGQPFPRSRPQPCLASSVYQNFVWHPLHNNALQPHAHKTRSTLFPCLLTFLIPPSCTPVRLQHGGCADVRRSSRLTSHPTSPATLRCIHTLNQGATPFTTQTRAPHLSNRVFLLLTPSPRRYPFDIPTEAFSFDLFKQVGGGDLGLGL